MVQMETRNLRKVRQGVVISNKMDKTIVIAAKFKEMTVHISVSTITLVYCSTMLVSSVEAVSSVLLLVSSVP